MVDENENAGVFNECETCGSAFIATGIIEGGRWDDEAVCAACAESRGDLGAHESLPVAETRESSETFTIERASTVATDD